LKHALDVEAAVQMLAHHLLASDLNEVKRILTKIKGRVRQFSAQKQKLEEGERD
jgi:hypothetical protein